MARALAPAKINITLEVLSLRSDGYHGVRSVMLPLGLADQLEYEPAAEFSFSCNRPELCGDDNLVVRAARAVGARPVAIHLLKHIPTQAGLGGGSSDAAAVLLLAASGALGQVAPFDAPAVARSLGSDVPFFLAECAALVEGTGERVTPLGNAPPWWAVVVAPPAAVSTAEAYAAIDARQREIRPRNVSRSLQAGAALQRGDFDAVVALLCNDFEAVVSEREPAIGRALEALRVAGGRPLLAGSGACVFALARDRAAAESLAARLELGEEYGRIVTPLRTSPRWQP
ncbi:MAG TPA: 4-(cytidine 5'-diphospho)-2-C-methyl-D-erythritol kinase [Candidatus Tumulicola sp.]|jgi:4-diphosphocytidyl-2-C-methyl-D-erythritol kinase